MTDRHPQQALSLALTIGHSTRSLQELVEILTAHGVGCLVDVRKMPYSRHNPQFNKETFSGELGEAGIGYLHLPSLGGLRQPRGDSPNAGWRNTSFRGYADYMQTPEFGDGLKEIIELSRRECLCLMCGEALWWRCHRRLIADALVIEGVAVDHLLGGGRRQRHRLTPWARVEGGRLTYPPAGSD